MATGKRLWAPTVAGLLACAGCSKECPLPEEFDGAFAKGTVCMPTAAHTTGTSEAPPTVPVRIELCLLDCVTIKDGTETLNSFWQCVGDQCEMVLLATARLATMPGKSCDGCKLEDPPASECMQRTVSFAMEAPYTLDAAGKKTYKAGTVVVRIPYVTLKQAGVVQGLTRAGRPIGEALQIAGVGKASAARSFTVRFDSQNPPRSDATALTGADCHAIPLP